MKTILIDEAKILANVEPCVCGEKPKLIVNMNYSFLSDDNHLKLFCKQCRLSSDVCRNEKALPEAWSKALQERKSRLKVK